MVIVVDEPNASSPSLAAYILTESLRGSHGIAFESPDGGTYMRVRTQVARRRDVMAAILGLSAGAMFSCLPVATVNAQTPDPIEGARMAGEMAHYGICSVYGCNGGGGSRIGYDPCYLAQNALRPCGSDLKASKPVGVDPHLVGTWELPFKKGPWVLEIESNGAYKFHSEAGDSVPPHSGRIAANEGRWSLTSKSGITDAGQYLYQAPDLWIAAGKLGAAAWRRPGSLPGATRQCAYDKRPVSKASGVDPNLVGTWELPLKGGSWVWDIRGDGSYRFHSEAGDGVPAHSGKFSTSAGHWTLTATNGYSDTGLYLYQAPDIWMGTGKLGSAAWRRPASKPAECSKG